MQIALLTAWLLQCSFIIQLLLKINTLASWQPGCYNTPFLRSPWCDIVRPGYDILSLWGDIISTWDLSTIL